MHSPLQAAPWDELEVVGEAKLNFLFWKIYDAVLYANTTDFSLPDSRPFALKLVYNRSFTKEQFVDETARQWEKTGLLSPDQQTPWLEKLSGVLVSVESGDELTLYVTEDSYSEFYFNDDSLGLIQDPEFTALFTAIWLSEDTTRPAFRADLLGE